MGNRLRMLSNLLGRIIHVRGKITLFRSRGEPGGVKAQKRTASISFLVLGSPLAIFSGVRSTNPVCGALQETGPLPYIRTVAVCIVRDHLFV
jgi:hypothetical protein